MGEVRAQCERLRKSDFLSQDCGGLDCRGRTKKMGENPIVAGERVRRYKRGKGGWQAMALWPLGHLMPGTIWAELRSRGSPSSTFC